MSKRMAVCIVGVFMSVVAFAQGHQSFDAVLKDHVTGGQVDYPAIAADRRFSAYLEQLKPVDASKLARNDQLAFWINAYNALAIQGILSGSSPRTFLGKVKFFYIDKYEAGGVKTNLYDLEHDILLPLGESRVHFAIVCASSSCPKLRSDVYRAESLDRQLTESVRAYVNDESRNRFDRDQKIAYLSKIFDWFDDDFVRAAGSVANYVARYVDDKEVAHGLAAGDYRIEHLEYDWNLNGTPPEM